MSDVEKVYAPWTEEQVEAMRKYQDNLSVHPYTCSCGGGPLIPTVNGWKCETCLYIQDWFYEFSLFMVDYEDPLRKFVKENSYDLHAPKR